MAGYEEEWNMKRKRHTQHVIRVMILALLCGVTSIHAKDKCGYQSIHWAAHHDHPDIVELLIPKGANANAKTSSGQTPLELASPKRETVATEMLSKHSAAAGSVRNATDAISEESYIVLERGDIRTVIINNERADDKVLPGHRAGYSGVASLIHRSQERNLFVPLFAGLNFEHIHDGTVKPRDILFEPRRAPMEIKRVDPYTAELYQPPTPHWQLENWLRYQLLEDGAIEMILECIPHARTFKNDYIGLFFASYINQPESLDIHFIGCPSNDVDAKPQWVRGVTPAHGELSTHLALDDTRSFAHDSDFPLTLVFNESNYRYSEPWYYGISHGMAFVLMFRPSDHVRLSQSPSGGGRGNPAWDFQWFIPQYEVGKRYQFVMRAMYLPFESREQIIQATAPHRAALGQSRTPVTETRTADAPGMAVPEGFVPLFNGINLDGWTVRQPQNQDWQVIDGVIDCDPHEGRGDKNLWTTRNYRDFELLVDWRIKKSPYINRAAKIILPNGTYKKDGSGKDVLIEVSNTDSGIFLRGRHKSQVNIWCWPVGSGEVWGYRTDPAFSAEVHAGVTPKVKADRPIGQWNTFHIVMKGDRLTVRLNGKLVIDNAQLPGIPAQGPIALQHHGDRKDGEWGASFLQFRRIFIKELSPPSR